MCFVEQMHYKCGHKNQGKVSKCRKFIAANVRHLFLQKPVDCGNAVLIHHDLPGICLTCTVSQAKKLMEKKKRREMELRKQEQRRREWAQFTAQAAAEKKKKEEELMWRQRTERERQRERKERGHAMSREEREALRRERVERARRERNHRPQEMRDLPAVSSTTPSMSRPGNPISRSNEHHFRQDGTATLKDPRVRTRNGETNPPVRRPQVDTIPVQTVAARKPVVVNPPVSGIPQPSRARLVGAPSTGERRRSGVEQAPPVPPKDPWRPHHPSLAPAPLSVPRSRPDGSAGASAGQPSRKLVGHIREGPNTPPLPSQKTQPPQRSVAVPGGVSSSSGSSSSRRPPGTAAPAQKSGLPVPAGYKPGPVFANRQGNNKSATATATTPAEAAAGAAASVVARVRARAKEAAASSSSSSLVRGKQQALPSANNTAAAPPKEEKKSRKSLLKRMMSGLGSDESVEWVSKDAARVERGE
ncbi:uncharacterized protein P884DRAFT_322350 [Thermothelomyces heterothallicus CBS 202.75]|uniref:uncharacterized protein n=1 Tax=Thermothelomyces heterothallicus CBS 202.75 TaxID=1149848 RepID=UPI00374417E7